MSQNLQNCVKFQKFQLEDLVDFEKCCKTHIFLQKSVPIQPKTNNILPKICKIGKFSARGAGRGRRRARPGAARRSRRRPPPAAGPRPWRRRGTSGGEKLGKSEKFATNCKFLAGSFSAVSKPNFASKYYILNDNTKYAFCSIFKLYKIFTLLHRSSLNSLAKNRFNDQ